MVTIAHIHNDLGSKFGVPRQSGLIERLHSTIVFEPEWTKDMMSEEAKLELGFL